MMFQEISEPKAPSSRQASGLAPSSFLFGHLKQLQADSLGVFMDSFRQHGDISALRFGPLRAFLLAHPEHIEHVLLRNQENYNKDLLSYTWLKPLLGEGLLTSDGELWQRQRRIAQPAFQRGRLLRFGPVMTRAAIERLKVWQAHAESGEPLDVHAEMMHMTLRIAGETLLGADVREESDVVAEGLEYFLDDYQNRWTTLFPIPLWVPTPANLRLKREVRKVDRVVMKVIEERRKATGDGSRDDENRDDLLAMLMSASDEETGESMTDRQLRDEVMTMLMAGHETTANALTWTWYLLARHKDVAERLRAELDSVLGGRTPTVEDLPRLTYTKMVIEESMRLYPPAWVVERRCLSDDVIGGVKIPARSIVLLSSYVTHRHPGMWDEPESFDPKRFHPEAPRERHRFAYFPFGGGPRVCIGGSFAMLEARLVLATLAQRYELEMVESFPVELYPSVTLRPRQGLAMRVRSLKISTSYPL